MAGDEELRRMVEEAARAAKAAQEAAERVAREQPSRWEQVLRTITTLLTTLVDTFTNRLRSEVDNLRRSGEDFVARVLRALSRSLDHLMRALALFALAGLFFTIAFVVLTVGLVALLNGVLGDPWGTLVVGGAFLLFALAMAAAARAKVRAVGDEADAVSPRRR